MRRAIPAAGTTTPTLGACSTFTRSAEGPLTEEPVAVPASNENGAAAALSQALLRLSGERRALIKLRYVEGLEVREMAEILGIPEGTVKSRLYSARQQIRDIMERSDR